MYIVSRFLHRLGKLNPLLVNDVINFVRQEVKALEEIREIRDDHLRHSMNLLEKSLIENFK